MPPAKGSKAKKGKKEVLPPASSFPDGHKNYYIGGWSSFRGLSEISSISHNLMNTYTGESREASPLPQTNVLILPKKVPTFSSVEAAVKAATTGIIAETRKEEDDDSSLPKSTHQHASPCSPDEITELVLADKMQIEGVPYLTVKHSQRDRKEWIPPPKEQVEEEEEDATSGRLPSSSSKRGSTMKKKNGRQLPSQKGRRSSSSERNSVDKLPEQPNDSKDGGAAASEVEEVVPSPPISLAEEAAEVGSNEKIEEEEASPCAKALRAYEEELERLAKVELSEGALFSSRNAVMDGVIRFVGVLPQIVVKPSLPTPPVRDEVNTGKRGRKKSNSTTSRSASVIAKAEVAEAAAPMERKGSGKKLGKKESLAGKKGGKKMKLTQEELEEIEKRMAEEDAKFLKDTEEAIEKAKEEEEYLMTFAHPNRWSHVTVTGVMFTGPVQVVRTHMKFLNCCFSSPYPNRPQLMIHQYCRVECVRCTFEEPRSSGVYGLPASQITIRKCLFTGIPQRRLVEIEGLLPTLSNALNPSKKEVEKPENSENEEEDGGGEADEKAIEAKGRGESRELPRTAVVDQLTKKVQGSRSETVGVFTDCSKVRVEDSRFLLLGFGSLFHGKYKVGRESKLGKHSSVERKGGSARGSASHTHRTPTKTGARMDALAILLSSQFQHLFGTGVCVDKSADDVLIQGNVISECAYYGLDLRQGSRNINVYQNQFLHNAAVRIREGVHPKMLQNKHYSMPVDDNKKENPCLELHY